MTRLSGRYFARDGRHAKTSRHFRTWHTQCSSVRADPCVAFLFVVLSLASFRSFAPATLQGSRLQGTRIFRLLPKRSRRLSFSFPPRATPSNRTSGLFTHHLLAGLAEGRADQNADGVITLDELHAYVAPRVASEAREAYRDQHPTLTGSGNRVVLASGLASTGR